MPASVPASTLNQKISPMGILADSTWSHPTLGLAEGFESARAWSKIRGLPCWSSFGSRRLDLLTIPSFVTKLVLAADRDLSGRRAVARSIEHYASDALSIVADYPPAPFKDWAEVLEAKERGGGGRR